MKTFLCAFGCGAFVGILVGGFAGAAQGPPPKLAVLMGCAAAFVMTRWAVKGAKDDQ